MSGKQAAHISKLVKALRSNDRCCFGARSKQNAVAALRDLAEVDEYRSAIVAAGAVPVLGQLLGHSNSTLQYAAAEVLYNLSAGNEAVTSAIAEASAVPALVRLLEHSSSTLQQAAAEVLCSLSAGSEVASTAIAAAGAVPALAQLLRHSSSDVQVAATNTLLTLSVDNEPNRCAITAAGAVPQLVTLLRHGDNGLQLAAAGALQSLAAGSLAITAAITAAGAVKPLVRLLGHSSSAVIATAMGALRNLAVVDEAVRSDIQAAGVISHLRQLLGHSSSGVQEAAISALGDLAGCSKAATEAIVAAGTVPVLVDLLGHTSSDVQAAAARSLHSLACDSNAVKAATDVVVALVQLLGSNDVEVQAAAADALAWLIDSPEAAASLLAAGAVPAFVRLLDHSPDVNALTSAARALDHLASFGSAAQKADIMRAGAAPALVRLLKWNNYSVPDNAVGALLSLAEGGEACRKGILDAGAADHLVQLLRNNWDRSTCQYVAEALGSLAADSEFNRSVIVSAGAVPQLVEKLRHVDSGVQKAAIEALGRLAAGPGSSNAAIVASKATPELVRLLGCGSSTTRAAAAEALQTLAASSESSAAAIIAANTVPALQQLLRHHDSRVQENAAGALRSLGVAVQPKSGPEATALPEHLVRTNEGDIDSAQRQALQQTKEGPATPRVQALQQASIPLPEAPPSSAVPCNTFDSAINAAVVAVQTADSAPSAGLASKSLSGVAAKLGLHCGFDRQPANPALPHGRSSAQDSAVPPTCTNDPSSGGSNPAPAASFTAVPSCSTVEWTDLKLHGSSAGSGSFGTVLLATLEETPVAAKVLVPLRTGLNGVEAAGKLTERQLEKFHRECSLLASVRHPNIVQILCVCEDPPTIVMEYCSRGSLLDVLKEARGSPRHGAMLSWQRRLSMALDAARGILHMHNRGIAHRDLKSPNLLVDSGMRVKVADFEFCRVLDGGGDVTSTLDNVNPKWQAPEVLLGSPASSKSDSFSMGVILWELMTWDIPWNGVVPARVIGLKMNGVHLSIPPPESLGQLPGTDKDRAAFPRVAAQYTQLIQQCWATNVADRPDFASIAQQLTEIQKELCVVA